MSLAEERDLIERQIRALEQNLGAAPDLDQLSSDTSSGYDGSDDDIVLEDPSHQRPSGLLAQRDQVQQEIEDIQTALVSQNATCPSDDDVSSSGESCSELDVPQTAEGVLQVNLVYQQVLLDSLEQLEQLLNHNIRAQKELLFQMSGPSRDSCGEQTRPSSSGEQTRPSSKMYLGHFLKPYFKDKLTGLGPPANQETRDRTNKMTGTLDEKRTKMKRWEGWQKTLLINSVSRDSLQRRIQPKMSKVDYLGQKLCSTPDEEKQQQLRDQIDQLERDIQTLRSQKEELHTGGRYDEHDWEKISNIDFEMTREADDLRGFWQNFLHPSVNKSSWSPEEMAQLEVLSIKYGERNWESIAEELGTGRTAFMCLQTYQKYVSKTLKKSIWSHDEDLRLRELVEKMRVGNFIPYTQMSYFMDGRDPSQLMYRWCQVLDPTLRRGPWSKFEDRALLRAVACFGERNWCKVRLEVPGRSHGACRDRYHDCLRAGIKKGAFDKQERELLVQLVEKHGVGRWSRIAAEIPNRTDAQCLRVWKMFLRHAAKGKKEKRAKRAAKQEESQYSTKEEDQEEAEGEVLYMDSDDEDMKDVVAKEKRLEQEEEEEKELLLEPEPEPQEKEKEEVFVPPCTIEGPSHKLRPGSLRYQVVESPCFGPGQQQEPLVRSTLVDKRGHLLDTMVALNPRLLSRGERHSPLAMIQLSCMDLNNFLLGQSSYLHTGWGRRPCSSLTKYQTGFYSNKRRLLNSQLANVPMNYRLMAAVTPWIGNLLVPDPTWGGETGADTLRRGTQKASLRSTPVFLLFLQVLNVDTLGCKDVIAGRQRKDAAPPPTSHGLIRKGKPGSVLALLNKKCGETQELREQQQQQQLLLQLKQVPPPQPLTQPQRLSRVQTVTPQIQWVLVPQVAPSMPPQTAPLRFPHPSVFLAPRLPQPRQPQASPSNRPSSRCTTTPMPPGNTLLLHQTLSASSTPSSTPSPSSSEQPAAPGSSGPTTHSPFCGARQAGPPDITSQPDITSAPALPAPTTRGRGRRSRVEERSPLSANQSIAGETPRVKRVRKTTEKATEKALREEEDRIKCKAKKKAASLAKCKTSRKQRLKPIGQTDPVVLPEGIQLAPGHTWWLMTSNGLVSMTGDPPPGLPPKGAPPPPMNGFFQPLEPPLPNTQIATPPPMLSTTAQLAPSYQRLPPITKMAQPHPTLPSDSKIATPPSIVSTNTQLDPPPPMLSTNNLPPVQPSAPTPSAIYIMQQTPISTTIKQPSISTEGQQPSVSTTSIQPRFASSIIRQPSALSSIPFSPGPSHFHPPRPLAPLPACRLSVYMPYKGTIKANPGAHPPPRREALQFDPALMFCEPSGEVQRWLSGSGGVVVPGLGAALPYLPPFVSSIDTLCALLGARESLGKAALQLLPRGATRSIPCPVPEHQYGPSQPECSAESSESTDKEIVAGVRQLVAKHFALNPAYQMLKARFLSCFTLPALLATIKPVKVEEVLKKATPMGENAILLQEGDGAPATQFTGLRTRITFKEKLDNTSQNQNPSNHTSTLQQNADPSMPGQTS